MVIQQWPLSGPAGPGSHDAGAKSHEAITQAVMGDQLCGEHGASGQLSSQKVACVPFLICSASSSVRGLNAGELVPQKWSDLGPGAYNYTIHYGSLGKRILHSWP